MENTTNLNNYKYGVIVEPCLDSKPTEKSGWEKQNDTFNWASGKDSSPEALKAMKRLSEINQLEDEAFLALNGDTYMQDDSTEGLTVED